MKAESLMHIQEKKIARGDVGHQRWPPMWKPVIDTKMPEMEDLGNKAVAIHNQREGTNLVFLKVVKAVQESFTCGYLYDLTLDVADGGNEKMKSCIQKMVWTGFSRQVDVPKETLIKRESIAYDETLVYMDNDTIEEVAKCGLWQLQGCGGTPALEKVVMHEVRETKDRGNGPEFSKFTTYRLKVLTKPEPIHITRTDRYRRYSRMVLNGSQFSFIVLERSWLKFLDPEVENSFRSRGKLSFPAPPLPIFRSRYHNHKDSKPPRKILETQAVISVALKLSVADTCSPFAITAAWMALEDHNFRTMEQLRFVGVVRGSSRTTSGTEFKLTLVAEDKGVFKLFKTTLDAKFGSAYNYESTPLTEFFPMSQRSKILDSSNRKKKRKLENSLPAGARSSERLKLLRLNRLAEEENSK